MKDFCGSYILSPNVSSSDKKKSNKVEKLVKNSECRCFPPFVKVHSFDCPLVKKKPCPVHGENQRPSKTDSCMILTFHPNMKSDGMLYPVQSVLTGRSCCAGSKCKVITPSKKQQNFLEKDAVKSQEVQTNVEDIKKSKVRLDNNCFVKVTKPFFTDKGNRIKKLKKCFHSPCDSLAHISINGSFIDDTVVNVKSGKNISVLTCSALDDTAIKTEDVGSKQEVEWFYFNPDKDDQSDRNKIIGFLRSGEVECDVLNEDLCSFNLKDRKIDPKKKISLLNPYYLYPTVDESDRNKREHSTPRNEKPKFEQEEFVYFDQKELSNREDNEGKNEYDSKEDIGDGTDYDQGQSDSSGSLFYTPFILLPAEHDKESSDNIPPVNREVQTHYKDFVLQDIEIRKRTPSMHSAATSAIVPSTKDKCTHIGDPFISCCRKECHVSSAPADTLKPLSDDSSYSFEPQNRDAFTQISSSTILTWSDSLEMENKEVYPKNEEDLKAHEKQVKVYADDKTVIKKNEAVQVARFKNEYPEKDGVVTEKTVVKIKRSEKLNENKEVKSVKVQTVTTLSRVTSPEKTVTEQNWQKTQQTASGETSQKPSTSFKLIQTSISITTTMPSPGCYCSSLLQPDETETLHSISPSNDTYVVKPFPSMNSGESVEKEVSKWLNKSNSDSKLYRDKKDNESDCTCDDSCVESICPLNKKVGTTNDGPETPHVNDSRVSMQSTKLTSTLPTTPRAPTSNKDQSQSSPVSDLSELIKIIDQGFDRMTNEMKGICDCKQRNQVKKERVNVVDREVMTDEFILESYSDQIKRMQKKEIHFTKDKTLATYDTSGSKTNDRPQTGHRVNIRQSVPTHETLNPEDVLICKLCANYIRMLTKDVGTNTEEFKCPGKQLRTTPDTPKPAVTQTIEFTNSTTLKRVLKKESNPGTQNSAIPILNKQQYCFDLNEPGVRGVLRPLQPAQRNNETSMPPNRTNVPSPRQNTDFRSESSTPKSNSPRERRRSATNYDYPKNISPEASVRSTNTPTSSTVGSKQAGSSSQRPNAPSQVTKNPSPPSLKPNTRQPSKPAPPGSPKKPQNYSTFPVRMPHTQFRHFFMSLQEEALRRYLAKSTQNTATIYENKNCRGKMDNPEEESSNGVPTNSEDEFNMNEYFFLRSSKSDCCSCHCSIYPKMHQKRAKDFQGKTQSYQRCQTASNTMTPRENFPYPCDKVIKSEESLKKGNRSKSNSSRRVSAGGSKESERSNKTVGDAVLQPGNPPTGNTSDFHCDPQPQKLCKYSLNALADSFEPENGQNRYPLNFREEILNPIFLDFSNDYELCLPEFSGEEETTSLNESNVEEEDTENRDSCNKKR